MTMIILPELGEGIKDATVASWLFKEGNTVSEGDDVVELVTDKATFNVPSPKSGILKQILVEDGQIVPVGTALAIIE